MKLIVISPAENIPHETELVTALFESGLEIFHIHKPGLSDRELQNYIRQVPWKFRERIFLHEDFLKFHSLDEFQNYNQKYGYAFLSPVFDSISKLGYKSKFDLNELKEKIQGRRIIALGGIDEDKIERCRDTGFEGVAVLGAIWQSSDPVAKFKTLKVLCQNRDLVF